MTLPPLHQRAATWAADQGFGMPNQDALSIGEVDPGRIRRWADTLCGLSPTLNYGRFDVQRQADLLATGWSTPAPADYLRRLGSATLRTAEIIDRARDVLLPAIDAIAGAQQAAARAITVANGAANWDFPGYVSSGTPEGLQRTAACGQVSRELAAQRSAVERAVAGVSGVFAADPRDGLDLLTPPRPLRATLSAPAADRADQQNWGRLAADLRSTNESRRWFGVGVAEALKAADAEGTRTSLLTYDPTAFDNQGSAVMAIGDLSTADHVVVLTPGIMNAPASMTGTVSAATQLKAEAERLDPGQRTSVVLWFGYDIPGSDWAEPGGRPNRPLPDMAADNLAAVNAHSARAGGALLAADLNRLRMLAAPGATFTAIGHSMGAVTTSEAARYNIPVDSMVLLAAPGAGYDVQDANDYANLTPEQVFALSFEHDVVTRYRTDLAAGAASLLLNVSNPVAGVSSHARSGSRASKPFGPDPASGYFRSEVIDAPSTIEVNRSWQDALDSPLSVDMAGHATPGEQHALPNYLSGAALTQVATVVTGRTSRVKRKAGRTGPG